MSVQRWMAPGAGICADTSPLEGFWRSEAGIRTFKSESETLYRLPTTTGECCRPGTAPVTGPTARYRHRWGPPHPRRPDRLRGRGSRSEISKLLDSGGRHVVTNRSDNNRTIVILHTEWQARHRFDPESTSRSRTTDGTGHFVQRISGVPTRIPPSSPRRDITPQGERHSSGTRSSELS